MVVVDLAVSVILEGLKYVPEIIDVGKDIWKRIKPPAQLRTYEDKNGVVDNKYVSGDYKFQISIPDENWRFWKPTPQFIASLGIFYALPVRDIPIIILSKNVVRLYRPTVMIVVEDVGPFTNIQEIVEITKNIMQNQGYTIDPGNIKISPDTNSAAIIAKMQNPFNYNTTLYNLQQIFLYAGKAYYITATYVPPDEKSPHLFGGLQDILNSFKLIK